MGLGFRILRDEVVDHDGFADKHRNHWQLIGPLGGVASRALHSPTSLCRLYIDYRESTGSPLGVEWEWSGSGVGVHIWIM